VAIEMYIAETNYNAYVMVVMTGGHFNRAGKRGSKLSGNHFATITFVSAMANMVLWLSKVM
jgi:hypothetical protein